MIGLCGAGVPSCWCETFGFGDLLGTYWGLIGDLLGTYWGLIRDLLGTYWGLIGDLLGTGLRDVVGVLVLGSILCDGVGVLGLTSSPGTVRSRPLHPSPSHPRSL